MAMRVGPPGSPGKGWSLGPHPINGKHVEQLQLAMTRRGTEEDQ